jgi:hypothetical protein
MSCLLAHLLAQLIKRSVRRDADKSDEGTHGLRVKRGAVAAPMSAWRNVTRLSCQSEQVTHETEAHAEAGGELPLRAFATTVGVQHAAAQI